MKKRTIFLYAIFTSIVFIILLVNFLLHKEIRKEFAIDDPHATYTITHFGDGYGIKGTNAYAKEGKEFEMFISLAPVPLEPLVNKRVKITGKFVLTKTRLLQPGITPPPSRGEVEAVELTKIAPIN